MSKIHNLLGIYAAFACINATNTQQTKRSIKQTPIIDNNEKLRLAEIERFKLQGLTEFFYGENSIWALNKKSADKKASKKNWI